MELLSKSFNPVALLAAVAGLTVATPAQADVTKLFNAAHSLSGDCSTTTIDSVPDPGCPGAEHPPEGKLVEPNGVDTDAYGNVYVLNRNESKGDDAFHIDIFDPDGRFLATVAQPGASEMTVGPNGHIYVVWLEAGSFVTRLVRYDPTTYEPAAGEVEYGAPPVILREIEGSGLGQDPIPADMAVDSDGHLFYRSIVRRECEDEPGEECFFPVIFEYGAPVPGIPNELLSELPLEFTTQAGPLAFDLARERLYVVDTIDFSFTERETVIKVFESEAPYDLLETVDGSVIPPGTFGTTNDYRFSLAVDEETGHLFVGEMLGAKKLYELDEDFQFVGEIKKPTLENQFGQIEVDNSPTSPNQGFLYVPSGFAPAGRLLAFEPVDVPQPPEIESISFAELTETEAVLRARVNPMGIAATWVIEYTSQQSYEAEGFAEAMVAGEGALGASGEGTVVQAPVSGLSPGTAYRFRVRAENLCEPGGCIGEAETGFTTFAAAAQSGGCVNEAVRVGPSAALPDCRAYELVTPADTNGLLPEAPGSGTSGPKWPTSPASPAGNSVAFMVFGGLIPGMDATGGPLEKGDLYVSARTASGWQTEPRTPRAVEAAAADSGGLTPDHGFLALDLLGQGSLAVDGSEVASYVREPDGDFTLTGVGSIATAATVNTRYVSPGGMHVIFDTSLTGVSFPRPQLEPEAPPSGTGAIYDRQPDGTLRVVSLLPGDLTPAANQSAAYVGASLDGTTVAFRLGGTVGLGPLYLRLNNSVSVQAAPAEAAYAGLSDDGRYLFYLLDGDLIRFDAQTGAAEPIAESGDADPVNINGEGKAVYFLSAAALPTGPNPEGAEPVQDAFNLYHWRDGEPVRFVASVTERDATGKLGGSSYPAQNGLGLWMEAVGTSPSLLSSRTSDSGSVLLFESRADLTGIDSGGKSQLFRYDADEDTLRCLSCNPNGFAPQGDTLLLPLLVEGKVDSDPNGLTANSLISNLSADGERAFFETAERLVARDNDGLTDVYEWEAQGTGGCAEAEGCLFLISSGQSGRPEHLFGASESGDDVFILSSDLLTSEDEDETPSIYDARVEGGFPPPPPASTECSGESCLPAPVTQSEQVPMSSTFHGFGNVKAPSGREKKCRQAARRAKGLSKRAQKLARASRRTGDERRAQRLHLEAKNLRRKARKSNLAAKRCRASLGSQKGGTR